MFVNLYQVHSITIREEDEATANVILNIHRWDYDEDELRVEHGHHRDGVRVVTYWIKPYIYDDFETILSEFKDNSILVM